MQQKQIEYALDYQEPDALIDADNDQIGSEAVEYYRKTIFNPVDAICPAVEEDGAQDNDSWS